MAQKTPGLLKMHSCKRCCASTTVHRHRRQQRSHVPVSGRDEAEPEDGLNPAFASQSSASRQGRWMSQQNISTLGAARTRPEPWLKNADGPTNRRRGPKAFGRCSRPKSCSVSAPSPLPLPGRHLTARRQNKRLRHALRGRRKIVGCSRRAGMERGQRKKRQKHGKRRI